MSVTIEFELVSPEKLIISEQVGMVVVPGAEGDIGVLPGHSSLITNMRPGVIIVYDHDKEKERIFIAGGFCEISPNLCTVLANEAMPVANIDRSLAEKRQLEAREAEANADEINKPKVQAERKIADAMLEAISI